jgi:hypothetical protein
MIKMRERKQSLFGVRGLYWQRTVPAIVFRKKLWVLRNFHRFGRCYGKYKPITEKRLIRMRGRIILDWLAEIDGRREF